MNKLNFHSKRHKLGNYIYEFTRFERPHLIDNFINQIDIYNENNIKLHSIKFDTDNADLIFLAMKALYQKGDSFEYEIPPFNSIEKYKISMAILFDNDCYDQYVRLIIHNKSINNESILEIQFVEDEYEDFLFLFFFMFLIDLGKVY